VSNGTSNVQPTPAPHASAVTPMVALSARRTHTS
jgi:hypothetical protein